MGQCLVCTRTNATSTHAMEEKETLTVPPRATGKSQDSPRKSGVDSAPDSGHSSGDDASCGGGGVGVGSAAVEGQGRNSHSSESSGKYSMRGSIGSCGECERSHLFPARIDECSIDLPVFSEEKSLEEEEDGGVFTQDGVQDSLHPLQDVTRSRKFSRGSSRGSRGSSSSERGSFSSVSSVTAILKSRLGRSSSLTVQCDLPEAEVLSTCSSMPPEVGRPHRTVSLRLPRSHRRPHDSDTNLPTIYVDDSPQQQQSTRRRERKSSLRRALSLLSMNTLLRNDAVSSSKKAEKPVQKILRQPRRRHHTVRGLSGLAIDRSNQGIMYSGLQRAHTLYYPTATSLRYATAARRTKSVAN